MTSLANRIRRGVIVILLAALSSCTVDAGRPVSQRVVAFNKQIALTFDDLPYANRKAPRAEVIASTATILRVLRAHRAKAVGFVNEDRLADTGKLDTGKRLLRNWLRAGMDLGNHNYGHVGLQDTALEAYEAAVLKGEVHTRKLLWDERREKPRYYRHPFTQTGPSTLVKTQFEEFLREHGYTVAPFTVEHDDYVFSAVYDDALAHGDTAQAAKLRVAYLSHLDDALAVFETMSQEIFKRQIPQVLLIHANRLNADTLEQTLSRLEARGYGFTTLDAALGDPAYATRDGFIGRAGPSWLLRWARGLRIKTSVGGQPDPEPWIMARYEEILSEHNPAP
jgi:peptidoglycan/xylan/chitin deacetylase (PgdA/CDA1 family)